MFFLKFRKMKKKSLGCCYSACDDVTADKSVYVMYALREGFDYVTPRDAKEAYNAAIAALVKCITMSVCPAFEDKRRLLCCCGSVLSSSVTFKIPGSYGTNTYTYPVNYCPICGQRVSFPSS